MCAYDPYVGVIYMKNEGHIVNYIIVIISYFIEKVEYYGAVHT
jgi:hypothetical protein